MVVRVAHWLCRRGQRPLKTVRGPRLLCLVNHYFGPSRGFSGKSTSQNPKTRRGYVEQVIASLRTLGDVDLRVCGVPGYHLLPLDVRFHLADPRMLIFETVSMMATLSEDFDYFVNIEDDVLLDAETFERVRAFDGESSVNECLHPNRMEYRPDRSYCVDLEAMPGWTPRTRTFAGHTLRVALNPHSGLSVLSRAKLRYAIERVDLQRREQILGGHMASAYANLHGPFAMFRVTDPLDAHKVTHLDWWNDPTVLPADPGSGGAARA